MIEKLIYDILSVILFGCEINNNQDIKKKLIFTLLQKLHSQSLIAVWSVFQNIFLH